jgi:hypothetical protein
MTLIKDAIRKLNEPQTMQVQMAIVKKVNKNKCTCAVAFVNEDADLNNVRLRALSDDKTTGFLIYPKVGSKVLVGFIDNKNTAAFVCSFSEIENIVINDGELGGLVKVKELMKQMQLIQANFETLKAANIAAYSMLAGLDSSASLNAFNSATTAMQTVDTSNLENEKIKQ